MLKEKFIFTLLIAIALGVGGYNLYSPNNQTVQADKTDEKQDESETKEEKEQNSDARNKVEEMTDEELRELIIKGKKGNKGEVEVTQEETDMLRSIGPDKYYDLMGITDEEVLGFIDGYHQHINGEIMSVYEEEYEYLIPLSYKPEFEWINENYDFEKAHYNESINEILNLMDDYAEGNQDALFSLKYILYELNEELNPETIKEERANKLTLDDATRIQNGEDPINK